jgi:uncharacterized membrane protein
MIIGLALHVLGAVLWVGGMYFALVVLRPSVGQLEPEIRLALWHRVLTRFFPLVWLSIAVLLASGIAMVIFGFGGFAAVGLYIRVMAMVGVLSMAAFAYLYFAPWRTFSRAVNAADWATAEKSIDPVRFLVAVNLILGVVTVVVGAIGRYYG